MSLKFICILIIFASFLSCNNAKKGKEKTPVPNPSEEVSEGIPKTKNDTSNNLIQITQPISGQYISSPLKIEGIARGYYFFEASFKIELTDENYQQITETYATALGEWMTEDWVPFESTLTVSPSKSKNGYLIFHKANPSGLVVHKMSDTLKIRFQ
jgi:hypothetical protein